MVQGDSRQTNGASLYQQGLLVVDSHTNMLHVKVATFSLHAVLCITEMALTCAYRQPQHGSQGEMQCTTCYTGLARTGSTTLTDSQGLEEGRIGLHDMAHCTGHTTVFQPQQTSHPLRLFAYALTPPSSAFRLLDYQMFQQQQQQGP